MNDNDYNVCFVPFTALLDKNSRNNMIHFSKWIDKQHGTSIASEIVLLTCKGLLIPRTHDDVKQLCGVCWYIVLKYKGKVVSVAYYEKSSRINSITTAIDERGKGHATYLMTYIRKLFREHAIMCVCPSEKRILPFLAKAGWTTADTVDNPDGTIDTMPDYVKSEYIRTTTISTKMPLNIRYLKESWNFMDYLATLNSPVPTFE